MPEQLTNRGERGRFAEYVRARKNVLARKPASMTFEQAAAIPQAAVLAPLIETLKDESLASAYFAAQLLAALGRSPAKLGIQRHLGTGSLCGAGAGGGIARLVDLIALF